MSAAGDPPVWVGEGDFGIVIDGEMDGDSVVEIGGLKVLLVDFDLTDRLPTAVLDFKDSPQGPRFTLDIF